MGEVQLDLFGEVEAEINHRAEREVARRRDALIVLRDAHPNAMAIILGCYFREGSTETSTGYSNPWAYSPRKQGLYFEHKSTWRGWGKRPAHLIPWDELHELVTPDARLADLRAWADRAGPLGLHRPYELWPHPETWNPGYIKSDHEQPGWPDRLAAWATLQSILTDAMERA